MIPAILVLAFVSCGAFDNSDPAPLPPGDEYDVEITTTYALGTVMHEVLDDGSSDFYFVLSNIPLEGNAEEFEVNSKGDILMIDLCAIPDQGDLPEGTYPFVFEKTPSHMQASGDYSGYLVSDKDGGYDPDEMLYFTEGAVKIGYTDDGYSVELIGKLTDGRSVRCIYSGMIDFVDMGGGGDFDLNPLEEDVNTVFNRAVAAYLGESAAGVGNYTLSLYDCAVEGNLPNLYPVEPGNCLALSIYSGVPVDGKPVLRDGTYSAAMTAEPGTVFVGYVDMVNMAPRGSYCEHTPADFVPRYGLIASGSVTVAKSGDDYSFAIDFMDDNGHRIQGTYVGAVEYVDVSYNTTLAEDYAVDLKDAPCEVGFFGDYYAANSDNWTIYIGTQTPDTDVIQLEILTPAAGFAAGLNSGIYPVADYDGSRSICIPGFLGQYGLMGSWYLSDFDPNDPSTVYAYAPAVGGSVSIEKNGAQYTIAFDLTDDYPTPNHITGTWTGTPTIVDGTTAAFSAKAAGKSIVKSDKKHPRKNAVRRFHR